MSEEPENNEEVQAPEAAVEETPEAAVEETPEAAVEEAPVKETAAPVAAPVQDAPVDDRPAHVIRKAARRAARGLRRPATPEERTELRKQKAAARSRYRKNSRERVKAKRAESPAQPTPPAEKSQGALKIRQGTVVSDKADKTITVRIDTARRHKRYEKIVRSSSTLHAHDEENNANLGDTVRVEESRPMSRTKRWKLVEVLERAK